MPDRDWIVIIVLGIGWGFTFFFNEVLLRELGPLTVSAGRVGTAAIFCWIYVLATGRSVWPGTKRVGQLAVLGTFMFAFPFAIYPIGQQYVASGIAGIVNALTPVMVVIVSHFWPGGERATPMKSLGVLAGFLGIVLLTIPAMGDKEGGQLFGTLVIVLAPICYALAMNYIRRVYDLDVATTLAWAFTAATILMTLLVLPLEGVPVIASAATWVSMLILGSVLTGLAFIMAFSVLPRAGATKMSSVTFIAPVSALIIGALVLDEQLGWLHFAGMAAIFAGLLLIDGNLLRALTGRTTAPGAK